MMDAQTDEDRKGMLDAVLKAEEEAHPEESREMPEMDIRPESEKALQMPEMDIRPDAEKEPPPNRLRQASVSVNPEETPSKETGDDKPVAGDEPPTEPWARIQYDLAQNANRKPSVDPLAQKMAAVGWTPKDSTPPDWNKLQADLQNAQHSAGLDRALQQGYQAVTGGRFHADMNAGEEGIQAAKAPLEFAQAKQRYEAEQLAAHQKLLAQAKAADLDNAESAKSRQAQAEIRDLFKDSRRIPSGLDKMSANEIAALRPTLMSLVEHDTTADAAKAKAAETDKAKSAALEDRKKVMHGTIDLDPTLSDDEKKAFHEQVNGLSDVGSATSLEANLNARMQSRASQAASEKGREETQAHADVAAEKAAQRSLQNQIALKKWEQQNQNLTAEQKTQLEGIEKSGDVLDAFEKGAQPLNGAGSVAVAKGAGLPIVGPAIAQANPGAASFDALREATAIGLARGMEGGTAKESNVGVIKKMLPDDVDYLNGGEVAKTKMRNVRNFVAANRDAFMKTASQAGSNIRALDNSATVTVKDMQTGKTKVLSADKAKKYLEGDPKRFQAVTGG